MEWMRSQISKWQEQGYINGAILSKLNSSSTDIFCTGVHALEDDYQNIPLLSDDLFDLASLTKVIGTTTRILQLFGEKKLKPNDSVNQYLSFEIQDITVEDLLLHKAGLPADLEDKSNVSPKYIEQFLCNWKPPTKKEMIYSDLGYLILGWIIETIDGCNLEESFQKNIFMPLNMSCTTYFPKEKTQNQIVPTERTKSRGLILGEVHDSKAWKLGKPVGSAGLFSTISDLARFVRMFFDTSDPVLKKEQKDCFFQVQENGRTYGWELLPNDNNETILFHTGFTGTSIGIDLVNKKALILLTNRVYYGRNHVEFITERKELYEQYFSGGIK